MRVNVKLVGWMREYLADDIEKFDDRDFDLPDGQNLLELIDRFGFRQETPFMVMRNGDRVLESALAATALADGDRLVFIPPLKGG
ncbi:MAG: MoaD/ThiS family protein [Gammaproteobacteria bacterium]